MPLEPIEFRTDGALLNAFNSIVSNDMTGLGQSGRDKFASTSINLAFNPMGRQELQALYRQSVICQKVVELLPKAATATNWLELTVGKGRRGIPDKAMQYANDLQLRSKVREAAILGRLDGDGFLVLGVDDGQAPEKAIDESRIRKISWVEALSRYQLFPDHNAGRPGKPEYYSMFLRRQEALGGQYTTGKIHRSRVLRFPGKRLYSDLISLNSGYHDSILQAFYQSFIKYLVATEYSARMVQDYNLFIYKLKGLSQLILQGKESDILKRFRAIQLSMSSLGGLAMDSENEDGQFISRNFGGLDQIIDRLKEDTGAAAGMPPTKLWGSSQKRALSNSAEGDKFEWADCVADWQAETLDEPLHEFFRLSLLAQNGASGGRLPESWGLKYVSALRLNAKEQVALRKDQTQGVDIPSVTAGILLPQEVRESAWAGAEYTIERTLQPDLYAKQQAAKEQQPQGQGALAGQQPDAEASAPISDDEFLKNSQSESGKGDSRSDPSGNRTDAADSISLAPEQLLDLKGITEEANYEPIEAIREVTLDDQGRLTWVYRDEDRLLRATLNGGELLTDYLGEVGAQKTDAADNRIFDILKRTDTHLRSLEDTAIDRINTALEQAYSDLEAKLLKLYEQESGSILGKQRALVLLSQVSDLLGLLNTRNTEQIQRQFENLLRGADAQGTTIAQELVRAIANENLQTFANVPIAAIRFAAENAMSRLKNHTDKFKEKASAIVIQGLIQGWGSSVVASGLRKALEITQGKAEAIARTETLAAHNEASAAAYQANGIEAVQLICTADDRSCPLCVARNMQVYKVGEISAPLHPRCRCYLLPWLKEYQARGLTNDEWAGKYRQESLKTLRDIGLEPDRGASPFERAEERSAPVPIWTPSLNLDELHLDTWHTKGKGKPRNCKTGRACGGSCISMGHQCKHDLSPGSKAKGEKVAKAAGAGKGKKAAGGGGASAAEDVKAIEPVKSEAPAAKPEAPAENPAKAAKPKITAEEKAKAAEEAKATKAKAAAEAKAAKATPKTESNAGGDGTPKDLKTGNEVPTEGALAGMKPLNSKRSYSHTTDSEEFHVSASRDLTHAEIVKAAKSLGGEAYIAKVEEHVAKIMENADIQIRVPSNAVLESIIGDRFKSQYETASSKGVFDPRHRAKVERDYMNYPPNTPNEMRPIYGYLADREGSHRHGSEDLEQYGDIAIHLKPEVKKRSTFTSDDSFQGIDPSAVINPKATSFIHRHFSSDSKKGRSGEIRTAMQSLAKAKSLEDIRRSSDSLYVEAQIHGQLHHSDIAEISYTKGYPHSEKVLAWAKANGVRGFGARN